MNQVNGLLDWWAGIKRFRRNGAVVRKSRFALWARRKLPVERLEDLKAIAKAGRDLESLSQSPSWEALLDVKAYFQNFAQSRAIIPEHDEATRFRAACEWRAIQDLFDEVGRRIQRGKAAQEELTKGVKTS